MTENNVMEFCQWLMNEKGIEAGNLSDYINNNEEEVLKLAEEFKKPKFKIGGKIESAAEMFKCGGKAKKKKVKKAQGGEELVNDKLQNIRDRNKFAKKRTFSKGNTSYDMTIGPDLNLFNDFNGKVDTLIRKSYGFKSPRSYSNEDLGHRFEVAFPGVAKFFGYKSGYQKSLDDINKMEPGGVIDGYKKIADEMGSKESFVRSNGDSVVLTTRKSVYPGFPGTDSLLFVKPMSGDEYIMHNHPTNNDRSWKGEYINTGKSFDPSRIKIEILKDLSKAKLKK